MPPQNTIRATVAAITVAAWLQLLPGAAAQTPIVDLATVRPVFEELFERRRIVDGPYGQYRMRAGDSSASYYGSLDVAIARTVMGEDLPSSLTEQQRSEWVSHLHTFANPDGTFENNYGHSQLHRNGMTIRGLSVLEGKQLYPTSSLYAPFDEPEEVAAYLSNNVDWISQWGESHKLSGGFHPFSQSSRTTQEWNEAMFEWLDANVDPNTGWWRLGEQPDDVQGLGGGSHIWPLYEHLEHDFPYPERVIDRILSMQDSNGRFGGNSSSYMDLDALYGLKYMRSLAPDYRRSDVDRAVQRFGRWLAGDLNNFVASSPTLHDVLAKVASFGMLSQLAPEHFPDSTGAEWLDYFTADGLYQTAAVETFAIDAESIGKDNQCSYSDVVLAHEPVGYWRLGQTGGLVAAVASRKDQLTGYYVGFGAGAGEGSLGQPGPRPANGFHGFNDVNRAVNVGGDRSYVSILDHPLLDLTGALTLEAWIRLNRLPEANSGIVAKYLGNANQRSYQLCVNVQNGGTGGLGIAVSPDGNVTTSGKLVDDTPLSTGDWLYVTGTFQPGEFLRLYINGKVVAERTIDVPRRVFESDADVWIGKQFGSASVYHLPGLIDEVAIYDRALSAGDIRAHYAAAMRLVGGDADEK